MKTQSGRSMIEIIGVLSLMGVLSIAVSYLYPYLMAHHKSNETWNDVLVQATVVQTSHTDDTFAAIEIVDGEELPSLITSEEFKTSAVGYPMEVYKTNDVQFIVQVDNVDYDACEIMLKKHSLVPDAIEVGNSKFEPIQENYDICGTSGTQTMYFYFGFCNGDINAVCDGGCGENFECFCGRCWCPIVGADAQTCQCPKNYDIIDGECVCPEDRQLPEGVCCPKGEHADGERCCPDGQHADGDICCPDGKYNSKGICCPDGWLDDKKQHRLWIADEEADECICQGVCDNGFVLNETNCTCECPTDTYLSNGVCCSPDLFDDEQTNRWIGQNGKCVCNKEYLNCQNGLVPNADCTACVCPKDRQLPDGGECCPVGQHAAGNICCEDGQYNSRGICCEDGDYNSDGVCCPAGETYATASKMCCPVGSKVDENGVCCSISQFNSETNECCPAGQIAYSRRCCPYERYNSHDDDCCPRGETYASGSQKCCSSREKIDKNGVCCSTSKFNYQTNTCCPEDQSYAAVTGVCCPSERYVIGEKTCCPEGQHSSIEGHCCLIGQSYARASGMCCPDERYDWINRLCCSPGETYAFRSQMCCPPERYNSIAERCCPEGQHYSNGGCCPNGQEYYSDLNACCAEKNYNPKAGLCCKYGYDAVEKVCKCPAGWNEATDEGYCYKRLDKVKAKNAGTTCANAGGFLPTLNQAQKYLRGTGLSVLLSDQRGNRCLKNGVSYFWIANLSSSLYTHTNFSCNNGGGYAYVSGYGEECHPETKTVPTCLRKR